MKLSTFGGACALTVMCAATMAAQSGTQAPTGQPSATPGTQSTRPMPQTEASTAAPAQTVTVTGCIQSAMPGATGSTVSKQFVLNNALMGPSTSSGAIGTSGATAASRAPVDTGDTGRAESKPTGVTYILDGSDAQLSPHAGHQVEVTGMLHASGAGRPATPGSTGSGTSASTPDSTAANTAAMASSPHFEVATVKMIASTCTGS